MALVGNWGIKILFQVTSKKILTFREFKQDVSGRYATHNILGAKPKSEFQGPELREVSLTAILSAELGINPRTALATLERAAEEGAAEFLFIGGKKIGQNPFCLTSLSETWNRIWNKGQLAAAEAALTFREYV